MDEHTIYRTLKDKTSSIEALQEALFALQALETRPDPGVAVPALKAALYTNDENLTRMTLALLSRLEDPRALRAIMAFVKDKEVPDELRAVGMMGLAIDDSIAARKLTEKIVLDPDERIPVREAGIKWGYYHLFNAGDQEIFETLLNDPIPDIRFWTCFALEELSEDVDISPLLPTIDHLALHDDGISDTLDWPVARAMLAPLMMCVCEPYFTKEQMGSLYIVTPAQDMMRYDPDAPLPDLAMEAEWLREAISQDWPDAEFDIEPHTQTLVLNWLLTIDNKPFIGGLHQDGYTVLLRGHDHSCAVFAVWLAHLLPDHAFIFYDWGDKGIDITPGMTGSQLAETYDKRRQMAVEMFRQAMEE